MFAWIRCLVRRHHEPVRHVLGGFRCSDCGAVGADLDEMGFEGEGYVPPLRRIFSRENGEYTRVASWDTGRRPLLAELERRKAS
jgi:hypothetical protein